jgi:hypothetical protein
VGGKTAVLLINPFMWGLLIDYILLHSRVIGLYHILFPMPILYMGILCLVFGNFFYTYSHLIGSMKRGNFQLVKWTLFIPIYWAMASIAAFMALQQLILKPHYWEKTQHGLHLRSAGPLPKIRVSAELAEQIADTAQPSLLQPPASVLSSDKSEEMAFEADDCETVLLGPTMKLLASSTSVITAGLHDIDTAVIEDHSHEEDAQDRPKAATDVAQEHEQ